MTTTAGLRTPSAAAPVVALVLALGACGGGSEKTTDKAVAPAAYVSSVCRAMLEARADEDASLGSVFGDDDSPAGIRSGMLHAFDSIQEAVDELRTKVGEAGTPDVAGGADMARGLRDELTTVSARLKANRDGFAGIPLSDVQPAASIEGAMTVLGQQMDAMTDAVDALGDGVPEVRQARERDPACTEFTEENF